MLISCFLDGVAAVEPAGAVRRALQELGPRANRVVVFALGKAAPAMVRGAAAGLDTRDLAGVAVSNHVGAVPPGIRLLISAHPVPDERSFFAGNALLDLAATLGPDDLALVLLSGGGSALAEVPVPGLTLADLAAATAALLRSGAPIEDVNLVRQQLSRFKGGGLGRAIAPARMLTLVLSDVVGDRIGAVASGPTIADAATVGAVAAVVEKWQLKNELPPPVLARLRSPDPAPAPALDQTIKLVGSGSVAAHGAAAAARKRGLVATVVDTRVTGEAAEAVCDVLERRRPGLSVFAGETTVTVTGTGSGGRNQEAALVAAIQIAGHRTVGFLAAGTDGIDGTTDAAGAVVDGATLERGRALGRDASSYLDRNDSGGYFAGMPDRLVTGPTGTNVGDLWMVLS